MFIFNQHTKLECGVAKFPVTVTLNANTSEHIISHISNNIMQEVYVQKHCILIAYFSFVAAMFRSSQPYMS